MTLQQLKYVITVAETGTITEAANQLFISQPSLTNCQCRFYFVCFRRSKNVVF